ncbi:MAG: glycosyltransferase family 2 protein [Vampirovibrionales bacterium]
MSNKPAISILVPVYNGERYLEATLASIEKQSFKDFEVICVDDISTDGSLAILETFAERDPRFKVVLRENKGRCAVTGIIYGLPYCQGDYFFYCSQDDLIAEDCLEKAFQRAIETGADAVIPAVDFYYEDGGKHGGLYPPNGDYTFELSPQDAFVRSLNWQIAGSSLRKMDLLKRIGYDDLYYNSCEYNTRVFYLNCNKVVFSEGVFYYREDNPEAITKSISWQRFEELGTQVRLLHIVLDGDFDEAVKNDYLKDVTQSIKHWQKLYVKHAETLTPDKREHVKSIMSQAKKAVWRLSFQHKKLKNIFKCLSLR